MKDQYVATGKFTIPKDTQVIVRISGVGSMIVPIPEEHQGKSWSIRMDIRDGKLHPVLVIDGKDITDMEVKTK